MSFFTALSLSLNNLFTKKARTLMVAFAGSIGIIGIALILSLSSGFQMYIDMVQEDTLSTYPLTIEKSNVDMSSLLESMVGKNEMEEHELDKIYSNDIMVDMLLAPAKAINDNNVAKYESKVENSRQKKIREMKLAEIAEMYQKGFKQREIAERLHLSQQIVSYRIGVIKTTYPDLLQPEVTQTAQINSDVYKNTKDLQKNLQTEYKNTNDTKKQNSVQICEEEEFVKEDERIEVGVKSPDGKKHFVF
jgi:predicted transcriptional regulator